MANPGGKIPFWLTLGFAIGLGFCWFVLKSDAKSVLASAPFKSDSHPLPLVPDLHRGKATLRDVEKLFMTWGGYCVWKDDLTQFAVGNGTEGRPTDFYEVRRIGRRFYFRPLARSDWPLIDHGRVVRCALWFAEPPEVREKFYRDHAGVSPGQPVLIDLPQRPPPLAPLSPREVAFGRESVPPPPPIIPPREVEFGPASLTPGAGYERVVPPWEAENSK